MINEDGQIIVTFYTEWENVILGVEEDAKCTPRR